MCVVGPIPRGEKRRRPCPWPWRSRPPPAGVCGGGTRAGRKVRMGARGPGPGRRERRRPCPWPSGRPRPPACVCCAGGALAWVTHSIAKERCGGRADGEGCAHGCWGGEGGGVHELTVLRFCPEAQSLARRLTALVGLWSSGESADCSGITVRPSMCCIMRMHRRHALAMHQRLRHFYLW